MELRWKEPGSLDDHMKLIHSASLGHLSLGYLMRKKYFGSVLIAAVLAF
jgi:hypothetical protein